MKMLHLALLLLVGAAQADQVIGVADSDTLMVLRAARPLKVWLADIDAPAMQQPVS